MSRLRAYADAAVTRILGVNSKIYWSYRFRTDWAGNGGQLQTALFATGFALLGHRFDPAPATILDFGSALGDSAAVLKMRFPDAKLYLHDLSPEARSRARKSYGHLVEVLDSIDDRRFDLVYCSNVIEHVPDPQELARTLARYSERHVVIQAPYAERHQDGSRITPERKKGEHVQTIDEALLEGLDRDLEWTIRRTRIPVAWDYGEQIFFIGRRPVSE